MQQINTQITPNIIITHTQERIHAPLNATRAYERIHAPKNAHISPGSTDTPKDTYKKPAMKFSISEQVIYKSTDKF